MSGTGTHFYHEIGERELYNICRDRLVDIEFIKFYPYLEPDGIDEALAYAAWRAAEIDVPLNSGPCPGPKVFGLWPKAWSL